MKLKFKRLIFIKKGIVFLYAFFLNFLQFKRIQSYIYLYIVCLTHCILFHTIFSCTNVVLVDVIEDGFFPLQTDTIICSKVYLFLIIILNLIISNLSILIIFWSPLVFHYCIEGRLSTEHLRIIIRNVEVLYVNRNLIKSSRVNGVRILLHLYFVRIDICCIFFFVLLLSLFTVTLSLFSAIRF